MTYVTPRLAFLFQASSVVAALTLSACDTPAVCPCPLGHAIVAVPTESVPVEGLSTAPPCFAQASDSAHILVSRQNTGTCEVSAHLSNGDTYTFSVEFRASNQGCCGQVAFPIDSSVPALADGGTP